MALTSRTDSPSPTSDTPTTDTATLAAIRAWKPRENWWQFELRPWHYVASFAGTAGVTAAVVLVVLTHAAAR